MSARMSDYLYTHLEGVLVHRVDAAQVGDAEEEDGGAVSHRDVLGARGVDLLLHHLGLGHL